MQYSIGDKLICRVNADETVVFDIDWNDVRYQQFKTKLFEVVGVFNNHYIILVPSNVSNSSLLDDDSAGSLAEIDENCHIDPKHFGRRIYFIQEKSVGGRATYDPYAHPLRCSVCEEYVPWALPNQEDDSFICWVCRNTRLYEKV